MRRHHAIRLRNRLCFVVGLVVDVLLAPIRALNPRSNCR